MERTREARGGLGVWLAVALSAPAAAWAIPSPIWTEDGVAQDQSMGRSVTRMADVTGDGVPDVAVGSSGTGGAGGLYDGRVEVLDGATGARLWFRDATNNEEDTIGFSVGTVGDTNGDGTPEIIVGAPEGEGALGTFHGGRAFVLDGATGATVCEVANDETFSEFGFSVAGAGDVDNDGVPDFVVGAPGEPFSLPNNERGYIYVYSGATCDELWYSRGIAAHHRFGHSVAAAGDMNGDGNDDVLVGAPGDGSFVTIGIAYVIEKLPAPPFGTPVYTYNGFNAGDRFGLSVAGMRRDVTGTADLDVAIGAPGYDSGGFTDNGRVYVYSGGTLTWVYDGWLDNANFGRVVAEGGDLTGDGVRDVLVSSLTATGGRVSAFSGASGGIFGSADGGQAGNGFGDAIDGLRYDLDGDGNEDFVVGAPFHDGTHTDGGRVLAFTADWSIAPGCAISRGAGLSGGVVLAYLTSLLLPFARLALWRGRSRRS